MNKGKITKDEYKILKEHAEFTVKYVFFEERDEYINIYFKDHDVLATKLTSDIIINNMKNRDDLKLRIMIDEVLNQICERMYYY